MKTSIKYLVFLLTISSNALFGWGVEGHKLVAKKALEALPAEFAKLSPLFQEIIDKSIDPDTRKDADKSEGVKHYIDIDYYPEFRAGNMITDLSKLEEKYGEKQVNRMGILPWAATNTYNKLVEALKAGDKDVTVRMMADLAHYVGDAHQPMHTIMNYNGQLSNQEGIHERYESVTIEKFYPEITASIHVHKLEKVPDVKSFMFSIILNSNILSPSLFYADSIISKENKGEFNDQYYQTFWKFTRNITIQQLSAASHALASLYLSAWQDAGKPSFENLK